MYSVKFVLDGRRYREIIDDSGNRTFEPPMSEEQIARYRERGLERAREICESRKSPGVKTDTSFLANRGSLVDQLGGDEPWARHVAREAKKHGHTVGANDVYISQLAEFPGDPKAFLHAGEGRGHIERVCRERGLGCHGAVNVEGQKRPIKTVRLAEDLVVEKVKHYRELGDTSPLPELREKVIETHGQKADD